MSCAWGPQGLAGSASAAAQAMTSEQPRRSSFAPFVLRVRAMVQAAGLLPFLDESPARFFRLDLTHEPYEPLVIAAWMPAAPLPDERYRLQVAHVGWTSQPLPSPDPELDLAVRHDGEVLPVRMRQTVPGGIRETRFRRQDSTDSGRVVLERDAMRDDALWRAWTRALRWQRWEQAAAAARPFLRTVWLQRDPESSLLDPDEVRWLREALCQIVPLLHQDQAQFLINTLQQGETEVRLLSCSPDLSASLARAFRSWEVPFRLEGGREEEEAGPESGPAS